MNDPSRRCVCGLSGSFPLCDGSHDDGRWACSPGAASSVEFAVAAGAAYRNLAERLAGELSGVAVHVSPRVTTARALVALTDGTDLDELLRVCRPVTVADRPQLLWLGGGSRPSLSTDFEGWDVISVHTDDPMRLWIDVKGALQGASEGPLGAHAQLPKTFLSHAVTDEPDLTDALAYMRRYLNWDVFVCADSIPPGADWIRQIQSAMDAAPVFVWLLSREAAESTFCAWEVGYSVASGRTPRIVSLDGTVPPAFAQHLQMVDVPRLLRRSPWLTRRAALVEALQQVLHTR